MLTIKKRGRTYYARGTIAGHSIRESTGCTRRADAEAWALQRERQILDRHTLGPQATVTFAECVLDYLNAGGEGRFLRPILEYFGPDFRAADMTNAAINAAALALYPTAAAATHQRQVITPIRAVMTRAAEDGKAPWRKFRSRKGDRPRTRWLRPWELDALVTAAAPHLRPIILAMVGTGCRSAEVLTAEASHFHPDSGELWVPDTKNGWPRMVKMPARARDAILTAGVPQAGPLFRKADGQPYAIRPRHQPIREAFEGARDRAGLGPDVTPHILRHTWATWFYASTRDVRALIDLGGWRTADLAMRYTKAAPEGLAEDLHRWGWEFDRIGAAIRPRGQTPAALYPADGGPACAWPQPGAGDPRARLRVAS